MLGAVLVVAGLEAGAGAAAGVPPESLLLWPELPLSELPLSDVLLSDVLLSGAPASVAGAGPFSEAAPPLDGFAEE